MHRAAGFSLLELLVTLAIIGILIVLAMPVLSRGKGKAQSVFCKNNLRQTGLAVSIYVSDFSRYPPLIGVGTNIQTWADRLFPSTPHSWTNRSWNCPAYISANGIVNDRKLWISYAYNCSGIFDGPPDDPAFRLGLGTRPRYSRGEPEVAAPGAMYIVGDARTIATSQGLIGEFRMRPYLLWPLQETDPVHGEGSNLLFGDGHVAFVKRIDQLFPPRTAPNWNRDNQPHREAWAPVRQWVVQK